MGLIIEDKSKEVTKAKITIPQNAKKIFKAMKKVYEPYLNKPIQGAKILKSLANDKEYNKKGIGNKETLSNNDTISFEDARKRLERQEKLNPNSVEYQLYGGKLAHNILKKGVKSARNVKKVNKVQPPKPTVQKPSAPSETSNKEIKVPNGKITYNESKVFLKENDDWHIFYDYIEEYDAYYVLGQFFSNPQGKQDWGVLINPDMYEKALREFTQYGRLIKFPTEKIYQWMGIIMKNTAILGVNTELAGHSQNFPEDEVMDYAERRGVTLEPTYEACSSWLEEQGLYDWMVMPDGSDAWSDYGLEPLWKILEEYNENLPPEKVLVLVNRALDVYHQRGDMASIFVQGGSKALSKIAESIEKKSKRKVYITEEQILKLWQTQ